MGAKYWSICTPSYEQYKLVRNLRLVNSFPPAKFKNLWFKKNDANLYTENGDDMQNVAELVNRGWQIIAY